MRRFVLVTATRTTPGTSPKQGSGIKKLKRGVTLMDFAVQYIEPLGHVDLYNRDGMITVIKNEPDVAVTTWTFTEYEEDDLLTAVANVSREELLRDLKEILPLKAGS
jgi:hypothetical protein